MIKKYYEKNSEFKIVCEISKILDGEIDSLDDLPENIKFTILFI